MKGPLSRLRFSLDHRWTPPRASSYLDDELSENERRRVARHVADCPECRALLHDLSIMIAKLGTLRDDEGTLVASTILSSVRSRVQQRPRDSGG